MFAVSLFSYKDPGYIYGMLNVSKSRKEILKFSFVPKTDEISLYYYYLYFCHKGQLISKELVGILNSSKKTNGKNRPRVL